MNKKYNFSTALRVFIQLFFLIAAPSVWVSAFAGFKSSLSLIRSGEPLELTAGAISLLLLCSMTFLFGRFFCGNMCAFGTLGDWVHAVAVACAKRLGKKLPVLPEKAVSVLKYGKFVVLAMITILCLTGNSRVIYGRSPWDAYGQILSGRPSLRGYEGGYIILLILIVAMALIPRFFCKFLCPLGAIFALLPPAVLLKLKKPGGDADGKRPCGSCKLCSRACPVDLTLNQTDVIHSGECIRCHRCMDACYQSKPHLTILGVKVPGTLGILSLALIFLICFVYLGMTRYTIL